MSDKTDSTIHVALSIWDLTDSYNRHAAVTMLSLLKNSSKERHVVFHLLYDENLSLKDEISAEENKRKYYELIGEYNAELKFHNIQANASYNTLPATKDFTVATLFRLYLPELLPDIDKLIYLDCDIVVNLDISQLYDIDMQGKSLAAVLEVNEHPFSFMSYPRFYDKLCLTPGNLFNAGVLLMNLSKIRNEYQLVLEATEFFTKYPNCPYLDQDFLNWLFKDDWLPIDNRYNICPNKDTVANICEKAIIHYRKANNKPWKSYSGHIDDYYWEYLSESPWGHESQDLIAYGRDSPNRDSFIMSIDSWIYRESFKKQFNILWNLSVKLWLKMVKIYVKKIILLMRLSF